MQQYAQQLVVIQHKHRHIQVKHEAVVVEQKDKLTALQKDKTYLEHVLTEPCTQLQQCSLQKGRPLRYSDLYAGCLLEKYVDAFTLLDTIEQNDGVP